MIAAYETQINSSDTKKNRCVRCTNSSDRYRSSLKQRLQTLKQLRQIQRQLRQIQNQFRQMQKQCFQIQKQLLPLTEAATSETKTPPPGIEASVPVYCRNSATIFRFTVAPATSPAHELASSGIGNVPPSSARALAARRKAIASQRNQSASKQFRFLETAPRVPEITKNSSRNRSSNFRNSVTS